jgi:hypothetical protein
LAGTVFILDEAGWQHHGANPSAGLRTGHGISAASQPQRAGHPMASPGGPGKPIGRHHSASTSSCECLLDPVHGRGRRVLYLHPIRRSAGAVASIEALRYDALQAELASRTELLRIILIETFVRGLGCDEDLEMADVRTSFLVST